jgi:hypothetical protein
MGKEKEDQRCGIESAWSFKVQEMRWGIIAAQSIADA